MEAASALYYNDQNWHDTKESILPLIKIQSTSYTVKSRSVTLGMSTPVSPCETRGKASSLQYVMVAIVARAKGSSGTSALVCFIT